MTITLDRRGLCNALMAFSLSLVSGMASAQDADPLRFGTASGYPPFEYVDADGQLAGFEIDLGNAICAYLERPCEWHDYDFSGLIPALKARRFDAIMSSMAVTEDRAKQVLFSDTVYAGGTQLVAARDSELDPTDITTLEGKRIGVEQGTTGERFTSARWAPEGVTVVPYADQDLVYSDLMNGRLDGVVVDGLQAQTGFLSEERGADYALIGERIQDPILGDSRAAAAVDKGNEALVADINRALAALRDNGTYDEIASVYFPPSLDISGN